MGPCAGFGVGRENASAGSRVVGTPVTWPVAASNVMPCGGSVHVMAPPTGSWLAVENTRRPGALKLELHTQTSPPSGVSSASASEKPPGA